jgi:Uma2 family endonuclease
VTLDAASLLPERVRPLHRREYERMVELGLFDDERIELLRGALVEMSPQGAPHSDVTERLAATLYEALRGRARVRSHSPLALSDDSEPEPDIAVVPPGDYSRELPRAALLVVEVADSSLRKDRRIKAELYAEAGVPEYWLVNLVDGVIELHSDPREGRYQNVTSHGRAARLTPGLLAGVVVDVGALLGR